MVANVLSLPPLEDEYHPQGTCSKGCGRLRSGESTRLPPVWPFFKSRYQRHTWVEFVCCRFSPLLRGFCPGTPVFPSPQKPALPNSDSIWNAWKRLNEFSRTLKYFLAKRITIRLFFFYQIYLGERGDGLHVARLPPSTAINPRAHRSVLFSLIQRWPPLTESARSRRSYGKIKDCEQSKLVKSIAGRFVQCLDSVTPKIPHLCSRKSTHTHRPPTRCPNGF